MRQEKLFEDTVHLERCEADPDPYPTEDIYYTNWQILYAVDLVLENTVVTLYTPPAVVIMEMFPVKEAA